MQGGFGGFGANTSGGFGAFGSNNNGSALGSGGFGNSTLGGGFGFSGGNSPTQPIGGFGSNNGGFGSGFGLSPAGGTAANTSGFGTGFGGMGGGGIAGGVDEIAFTADDLGYEILPPSGKRLVQSLVWSPTSKQMSIINHDNIIRSYIISDITKGINSLGLAEKSVNALMLPECHLGPDLYAWSGCYITDQYLLIGCANGEIHIIDTATGNKLDVTITGNGMSHTDSPIVFMEPFVAEENIYITGAMNGTIIIWMIKTDNADKRCVIDAKLGQSMNGIKLRAACTVKTGRGPHVLLLGSDNTIYIMTLFNGQLVGTSTVEPPLNLKFPIECLAIDKQTYQLFIGTVAGRGAIIKLDENTHSGNLEVSQLSNSQWTFICHRILGPNGKDSVKIHVVYCAAFTNKNKLLTSGGDGGLYGWDMGFRKQIWAYNKGQKIPLPVRRFSLSPNEEYIAIGCSEDPLHLLAKGNNCLTSRILVLPVPQTLKN